MIAEGQECRSDYVVKVFGADPKDRFKETIFKEGGFDNRESEYSTPFRRKTFEAYMYSDPETTGR